MVVAIRLDEPVKSASQSLDRAIAALPGPRASQVLWPSSASYRRPSYRAYSSGQRFFTDASRNLLTGLCLLAITDDGSPTARGTSQPCSRSWSPATESAVKSLEELAADLPTETWRASSSSSLSRTAAEASPSSHRAQLPHVLLRRRRQPHALGRARSTSHRSGASRPSSTSPARRTRRRPRRARLVHLLAGAVGAARDRAPVRRQAAGGDTARHRRGVRDPQRSPRLLGDLAEVRSIGLHVVFVPRTPICLRRGAATPGRSRTRCWRCSAPRSSSRLSPSARQRRSASASATTA